MRTSLVISDLTGIPSGKTLQNIIYEEMSDIPDSTEGASFCTGNGLEACKKNNDVRDTFPLEEERSEAVAR